ncbi:MAG: hypothetical protein HOV66_05695, partial [Streptomycetaceae bacterium]|nr:hypothetical protein [Streptomycetaceae bacterium]
MSDRFGGITARLRNGNGRLVDTMVVAAVAVAVFVPFATASDVTPLGFVVNLGTVVPLFWRRRAPFAVALAVAFFATAV